MREKKTKRLFAWLLSMVMVISMLFTGNVPTAYAAGPETDARFFFNGSNCNLDKATVEYKIDAGSWTEVTSITPDDGNNYVVNVNSGSTVYVRVKGVAENYHVGGTIGLRGSGEPLSDSQIAKALSDDGFAYAIASAGDYEIERLIDNASNPGPSGQGVGAGDVKIDVQNNQNGKVYYKIAPATEWTELTANPFTLRSSDELKDVANGTKIYIKATPNQDQKLDTNDHQNCVRVDGAEIAANISGDLVTEAGYELTYDTSKGTEIGIRFEGGSSGGQGAGPGDVKIDVQNNQNGRVYYKIGADGRWEELTANPFTLRSSNELNGVANGTKIYIKAEPNQDQSLDTNDHQNCVRVDGAEIATNISGALTTETGYELTYDNSKGTEVSIRFEGGGSAIQSNITKIQMGFYDTKEPENGIITIYDSAREPRIQVPGDLPIVVEEITENGIDKIAIMPQEKKPEDENSEEWLAPMYIEGDGEVVFYAGLMLDAPEGSEMHHIEQDTNITVMSFNENGYDGKGTGAGYSIYAPGNVRISFNHGNFRAAANLWGGIYATNVAVTDLAEFNIGNSTEKVPVGFKAPVKSSETDHSQANYIDIDLAQVQIFAETAFENYGLVRAVAEAKYFADATKVFENVDQIVVQTGGSFDLNSSSAITMPSKVRAEYYTEVGEILDIDRAGGRYQDCVQYVDCEVGDSRDKAGRYIYTNEGNHVKVESTTGTLWSLGYQFSGDGDDIVTNGDFEISAGSGLREVSDTNGGSYFFEAGTEVKFKLLPDAGYKYEEGTFCFNGDNSEEVVKPTEEPGVYIFTMPSHPIHVSCSFIEANSEISIAEDAGINGANVSLPEEVDTGIAELEVEASELNAEQEDSFEKAAGELAIGTVLDLSLNQYIDKIGTDEAWRTPITDTKKPVTVTLALSEEDGGKENYSVIREHNGEVTVLDAEFDPAKGELTFESDGFSTYAIAYTKDPVSVTGVVIDNKEKISTLTKVDETTALTATVEPKDADNQTVTWSSSDEGVVTVDEDGVVTAVGNGTATITVTTKDGKFTDSVDVTVEIAVTGVTIEDKEMISTLDEAGAQVVLTATVEPSNADNQAVTWTSSDEKVATVDEDGVVTAVGNGTATITVTTEDGEYTDSVRVIVEIVVTGVRIEDKDDIPTLTKVGETTTIVATVIPENAKNQAVTWTSSDEKVATVDEDGVVTAVGNGTAKITVTTEDGKFTDFVDVTVDIAVTEITITSETPTELTAVNATVQLKTTYAPTEAVEPTVSWKSDDESIATVDPETGIVTAVSNGVVTITATTEDGITATIPVTVKIAVDTDTADSKQEEGDNPGTIKTETNISNVISSVVSVSEFTVSTMKDELETDEIQEVQNEGADAKISLYVTETTVSTEEKTKIENVVVTLPEEPAFVDDITLDISVFKTVGDESERLSELQNPVTITVAVPNDAILDSAATGVTRHYFLATIHGDEASIIEDVTFDANAKTISVPLDKFSLYVLGYYDTTDVTAVEIKNDELELTEVGATLQLTTSVEPSNASISDVTWKSSNPEVATVDENGKVTAVASGTTVITATSKDNSGITDDVTITVAIPVSAVKINKSSATLTAVGETVQLQATVEPSVAVNTEVAWSSSNIKVATVDATGKVTAVGNGTATITATAKDGSKVSKTCTIKVDIPKPEPKPETPDVTVSYHTHIQSLGDKQATKVNGQMAGTMGQAKRLENIWIKVAGNDKLGIQYSTHCQSYGWLPWSTNGELNGTSGEAKRLEAIKIQLTGADKDKYDVYYRVHAQSYGWLAWAKNGEPSGTAGYAKRLEGIQIVVVKKGSAAPGLDYVDVKASEGVYNKNAYIAKTNSEIIIPGSATTANVMYKTHVQTYGWQTWRTNGQMSGTSGEAKRLEGINVKLSNAPYSGGITYRTHVQSYGWQAWKADGAMSGTSGEKKRLEAIEIKLTGEMANHYDVYYRVHAQSFGWLAWAKNGESAGTEGLAKRLEGIQIILVPKGEKAPGATYDKITSTQPKAFIKK